MHLTRLLTTAAAAALIACPVIAVAAGEAPAAPPAAAAPSAPATAQPAAPAAPAMPSIPKIAGGSDIYSTLKASGHFTILLKAADQTGIAPVLQRYPNLTFFAPTDEAFNALPADVLSKLLAPGDAAANQLQQILKYHLVNAQLDSSKLKGAKGPVPTVKNTPLQIDGSNPKDVMINNADIIQADVRTTNGGIVHAIDKVLVPTDSPYASLLKPASAPTPSAAAKPQTIASGG